MIEDQIAKQSTWQTSLIEGGLKPLADEQCLGRVLEQDRVAGHQRGHDGVDGGQKRIVPRGDHEHGSHRLASNESLKTVLRRGHVIRESRRSNLDHVTGPLFRTDQLAASVTNRTSHVRANSGTISSATESRASIAAEQKHPLGQ